MADIGLVTCDRFPDLDPDSQMLIPALEKLGYSSAAVMWTDAGVDWSQFRLCLIRSTWDYETQRAAYLAWAERVSTVSRLWNPPDVIRWNTDKRYLLELWQRGVPIIPTVCIETGAPIPYDYLRRIWSTHRLVIKPAVAAGGRRMGVLDDDDGPVTATETTLLQPFLETVETAGELSIIFFGGEFSHAVSKKACPGEYRVQEEWGGTYRSVTPSDDQMRAATRVISAIGKPLLYARLDFVFQADGQLLLSEAEVTEPSLYHHIVPESADTLAGHMVSTLADRAVGSNL